MIGGKKKWSVFCDVCQEPVCNNETLKRHMMYKHIQNKQIKCEFCDKSFIGADYLKSHMVQHSDVKKFMCTVCDKSFHWSSNLISHLEVHKYIRGWKVSIANSAQRYRKYQYLKVICHNTVAKILLFATSVENYPRVLLHWRNTNEIYTRQKIVLNANNASKHPSKKEVSTCMWQQFIWKTSQNLRVHQSV